MFGCRHLIGVLKSRRGAIALMFGIVWGPLIGWTFMALDLALNTTDQVLGESAFDTAMLAALSTPVSAFGSGASAQTIQNDRQSIVNALWAANGGQSLCGSTSTITVPAAVTSYSGSATTTTLTGSTSCTVSAGSASSPFTISSTVELVSADIEVAMVLDNTGSMAYAVNANDETNGVPNPEVSSASNPSKMTGLKVAAYNFVNGLLSYANASGEVKVSIVPMVNDINIGTTSTAKQLVKYSYQSSDSSTFDSQIMAAPYYKYYTSCYAGSYSSGPANILAGTTYFSNQALSTTTGCGSWSGAVGSSTYTPGTNSVSSAYTVPSTGVTSSNWSGCVVDRDQIGNPSTNTSGVDYDISDAAYNSNPPYSLYPADNINCGGTTLGPMPIVALADFCPSTSNPCVKAIPQSIMNLLYCRNSSVIYGYPDNDCANYSGTPSALKTYTSNSGAMIANGGTDLTLGLAWGLNMLQPGFPLANASQSTATTQVDKFLVFFTDGFNSLNRFAVTSCTNDTEASCSASGSYTQAQEYQILENMNTETLAICQNIKNYGFDTYNPTNKITIYTIGTLDADSSFLSSCATNSSDAYTNLTASGINGALQSILASITALRVSN